MREMIKGLRINVTVDAAVKCGSYAEEGRKGGKVELHDLDLSAKGGVDLSVDELDSSVELEELLKGVKEVLSTSIAKEVKKQLSETKEETK